MNRIRSLFAALLLPLLLPVQLSRYVFQYRMGRVRAACAAGDRGAISIELALAVVALVAVAAGVVGVLYALAGKVKAKVNDAPIDAPTST
ncbi:hypothetical protein [Kitasatospora sp. GP82]|uniref:hypothetical protein n=1 Tax=Kitasatospora sp. GP82 TaxID=3035089 RepID=UPI0024731B2B|nr:hypothetical protein [Kitasatospora sp. GP82]MDH6125333.1 Flp pilus assembly protein TadG [Kitasatospora sp. GP82]